MFSSKVLTINTRCMYTYALDPKLKKTTQTEKNVFEQNEKVEMCSKIERKLSPSTTLVCCMSNKGKKFKRTTRDNFNDVPGAESIEKS